ncbi:major facilitator superfamily protein [Aulographum hederae CBS 113979]|uniref:Major facilitator superfamily protein n=1 Tax=Aulographum hederae CBS 113979 TaxID=1176131 RepID=A0A6G1HFE5_9PEZI|nr:major facilitator superfamily protein [Aulographum hederae CBS 113979]
MAQSSSLQHTNDTELNATTQGEQHIHAADAPPDGGYGWAVVASCFTLNAFTWGVTASFGVYLTEYLSSRVFLGAKPLDYGFIGGFNFAFAMLVAPLATYLTRKFGKRNILFGGSILQCGGYVAASFATRIWHLYLSQGLLVGCGIGFIWFSRKRSVANGISSAGSGIGGVVYTWGTASVIRSIGLAWALRTTGLITLAANITATFFIRDRNHHIKPTQLAFDITLLRRYDVILLLLWAFISMFGYITLLFSLFDFATWIHLSRSQAADIVGFLNLGTAVGRPIIGIISDRFSRTNVAAVLTLACGIICFALWLPATSFGLTVFFALVCGAILGVFWMTIGPLCVEVAGLKNLPSLLSLSWFTIVIPTASSEAIALVLRRPEASRQYLYPQTFAGVSYIVASLFMLELWRVLRRRREP